MISLNDYLYEGDTVLKIIQNYASDLRENAKETHNEIDMAHCNFLIQIEEMLEHNDFLTAQYFITSIHWDYVDASMKTQESVNRILTN